jgi:hypothetical protein
MDRSGSAWMRVAALAIATACGAAACDRCDGDEAQQPAVEAPPPQQPRRVAAEDRDLRVLLAELAASKACEMIRGNFSGLQGAGGADTITGILWLRGCRITRRGTEVTFHLSGEGWQWIEVEKEKAGGTFTLRQYVRFEIASAIRGQLDVGYDTKGHILSFWFTPEGPPVIDFTPVGDVEMDKEGAWSSVVGAMASLFSKSIDERARDESDKNGTRAFLAAFGDGMAVTMDLCTGLTRFGLERPPQGKMVTPGVGETRKVPVELQPAGVMVFGPYPARRGMTVEVRARTGVVAAELACQEEATRVAEAFMRDGRAPPTGKVLARKTVSGKAVLRARRTSCPVMLVTRALSPPGRPVVFDWRRPAGETAREAGGPVVQCERGQRASR